ncbi:hypothetical protein AVEN_166460-1, partial [Araneus ventricosus]
MLKMGSGKVVNEFETVDLCHRISKNLQNCQQSDSFEVLES